MSLGLEVVERRLMDLVPAPAVTLMKSRVKSRPGVDSVQLMIRESINRLIVFVLLLSADYLSFLLTADPIKDKTNPAVNRP